MASGTGGPVNGYAFPDEPEDGTVAPDDDHSWWGDYIGIVMAMLAIVGCIVVCIRIFMGLMDGSPLL